MEVGQERRWDYDYHQDTSMKKCNKYYEYPDSDQLKQRALLNLSISSKLQTGQYLAGRSRSKRNTKRQSNNERTQVVYRSSQQSDSTLRPRQNKKSMSSTSNSYSRLTAKPVKKAASELKYYKRICAEMRKKNTELEEELIRNNYSNKENIRSLQNRLHVLDSQVEKQMAKITQQKYGELTEQMAFIKERLGKKEAKEQGYRRFFRTVVQSLRLFGLEQDSARLSSKQATKLWNQTVRFLVENNFKLASQGGE